MNSLNANHAISSLLTRQDLWLGHPGNRLLTGHSSGFDELRAHLPHWPAHGVCELLCDGPGSGVLGLLLPLLESVCANTEAPIMLIVPPLPPNAHAFALWRLPPERFVWLDISAAKEALWAMEQALRSGSCGLVIGWFTELSLKAARRLQLAAEEGDTLSFCVLPLSAVGNDHPLPLKLAIESTASGQQLQILKRRGASPVRDIALADLAVPLLRRMQLARRHMATPIAKTGMRVCNTAEAEPLPSLFELSQLSAANDRHQHGAQHG
ncbi:translesion DNA synthesis-associated protein ImuA [Shewanella mangrovi]|uniref:translesion DNA synthesis-associated protein ImuA n=1 Tax=Shewanella mangrovi TaxID=1515746 RepID=UPI00068DC16E|nr:translesion DNA synthesis-associated protein ImuA [Shewanella mangrovi]